MIFGFWSMVDLPRKNMQFEWGKWWCTTGTAGSWGLTVWSTTWIACPWSGRMMAILRHWLKMAEIPVMCAAGQIRVYTRYSNSPEQFTQAMLRNLMMDFPEGKLSVVGIDQAVSWNLIWVKHVKHWVILGLSWMCHVHILHTKKSCDDSSCSQVRGISSETGLAKYLCSLQELLRAVWGADDPWLRSSFLQRIRSAIEAGHGNWMELDGHRIHWKPLKAIDSHWNPPSKNVGKWLKFMKSSIQLLRFWSVKLRWCQLSLSFLHLGLSLWK